MSNFCGGGDITKIYIVSAGGTGSTTNTDIYVTGFTYDNSILTISQNGGQPNLNVILPTFITGSTDYYVTGGTYSNGVLTLNRQDSSFTISGFLTGTTTDIYTTGFTYSNNNLIISQNEGQPDLVVIIDVMSGLTINGSLSATTYLGLPIDPDNYVTGGTYLNGTLTLDRQNGSLTITGFTTTFTGNTSGDCITDLFVSNVNSCSPLHIQPINNGDVYISESGGNVGVGTTNPLSTLDVNGKITTTNFQMTSGSTYGYVLTSDVSGNAYWASPFSGTSVDTYVTGFTFSSNVLTISQNQGKTPLSTSIQTIDLSNVFSAVTFNIGTTGSISATTFYGSAAGLTGINDFYVTGFTYSNNNLTISQNQGQTPLTVNISTITGLTASGGIYYSFGTGWTVNQTVDYISAATGNILVTKEWVERAPSFYTTARITTSAATLNIGTNYYGVNYNGNVDISLPNPSGYDGYNINIKDESGNAGIYRIRLTPLSGLIDGNNYVDMNINYMSLHVVARNNNWWII
jgi:hypothetical protein